MRCNDLKIGVVRFPGTNNEHETIRALASFDGVTPVLIDVWNHELVNQVDGLYLPGGFSYGDFLRAGAIAATTETMQLIKEKAKEGTPILSICNGFQVTTESSLLEGVLLPNNTTRFVCKFIHLRIETNDSYLSGLEGQVLKLPIAHFEGNLWHPSSNELEKYAVARYSDEKGDVLPQSNPNGSLGNIAGISNETGVIVGMMPHPERAVFPYQGSTDGRLIINSFLEAVKC